ncbi:MAG: hypothetical protein GY870_20675 [archaeon]|nr:hypothetical protein [archaeon]
MNSFNRRNPRLLLIFILIFSPIIFYIFNSFIIESYDVKVLKNKTNHYILPDSSSELASEPIPLCNTTYIHKDQNLSWSIGEGIIKQNVFFGDNLTNIPCVSINQTNNSFDPGIMELNTWYYWRIDSVKDNSNLTGDTWKFFVPGLINYPSDGEPIGGGYGYSKLVNSYDIFVNTKTELLNALDIATQDQIIYINDTAEINLTSESGISIPSNVTLASGRGKTQTNRGGLIHKDEYNGPTSLFIAEEMARITGLRIQGPNSLYPGFEVSGTITGSRGITAHDYIEIDNCELYNWSYAAIDINEAQGITQEIHNNYIHDCSGPLGYGVEMGIAQPLIKSNIFSRCRHAIAGIGQQYCSYEACYNIVLESGNNYGGQAAHSFDMHGSHDHYSFLPTFLSEAGSLINIHNNTFSNPRNDGTNNQNHDDNSADICIRGRPREYCYISDNWFINPSIDHAVRQVWNRGNIRVWNNVIGINQVAQENWDENYWSLNGIPLYYALIITFCFISIIVIFFMRKKIFKKRYQKN